MLELSQVRSVVEANIKRLSYQCQVNDWWLYTKYVQDSEVDWMAQVDLGLADYRKATITFNVLNLDTEEAVVRALRHELLHILLAPFEIYDDVMHQYVYDEDKAVKVRSRMRTHALELIVGNLERMLDCGLEIPLREPEPAKPKAKTKV